MPIRLDYCLDVYTDEQRIKILWGVCAGFIIEW